MRKKYLLIVLMCCHQCLSAQTINPDILSIIWNASWIEMPGAKPNDYGVYHLRKNFTINDLPQHFIIHVTADNRYKLYVNDSLVSFGPAKRRFISFLKSESIC